MGWAGLGWARGWLGAAVTGLSSAWLALWLAERVLLACVHPPDSLAGCTHMPVLACRCTASASAAGPEARGGCPGANGGSGPQEDHALGKQQGQAPGGAALHRAAGQHGQVGGRVDGWTSALVRGHSDQEPLGPHHHHLARWQQPLGSLWEQPFTIPAPCSRPPGPPAPASLLPAPCRRLQLCVPAELCMQPSMRGQLITCDYFAKIRLVVGSCVEDMKLKASSSGLGWAGLLLPPASAALCCPRPLCCQRCCQPRRCCCCGGGCPLLPGWRAALCCRAQPASTAAPFPPAGAAGAIYRDCPAAAGHRGGSFL